MSLADIFGTPAWWAFLGSAIYSLLKVTACVYDKDPEHGPVSRCYVEAAIAVIIGTIAGAAFEPWLIGFVLHGANVQEARAVSAVIGLLAYPTGPGIIRFLGDNLLTRIRGGH